MFIPFLPKDTEANDFNCRDGEIDYILGAPLPEAPQTEAPQPPEGGVEAPQTEAPQPPKGGVEALTVEGTFPTANIRIPLQSGDADKAALLLGGEASRVDAATADRLTQAIVQKAAEVLLDITTDCRRQGMFLLPFRVYTMLMAEDGTLSFPSPQAIALPTDFPPHPEITASSIADNTLTIAIRFPVRPHRLTITPPSGGRGASVRTFISYPLYIPDPKEMRGSIGSVRSAVGGNAIGIRFAFLSKSSIKASVAAPEKYYEFVGNERTGYRISSKAAAVPDYTCYVRTYGLIPSFAKESMIVTGGDVDSDTDPLDWIADWKESGGFYLPRYLPYTVGGASLPATADASAFPDGIDRESILAMATENDMDTIIMTRPMALCDSSGSKRRATSRAIRGLRVQGLRHDGAMAILYGSHDGVDWEALRIFNPDRAMTVPPPPRLWWRLLLLYRHESGSETVFTEGGILNITGGIFLLQ